MNNKSIFLLIAAALLSLTLINCSSDNNKEQASEPVVQTEIEQQASEFVSTERPNDFPAGSNTVSMDESLGAYVVSSQESGCRILVKQEGSELSIDSEVDCSQ